MQIELPELISASLFTCETAIEDTQHVHSFIRVVDIFYFPSIPEELEALATDPRAAEMTVAFIVKMKPQDTAPYRFRLDLIRPNGLTTVVHKAADPVLLGRTQHSSYDVPNGLSAAIKLAVRPSQMGVHYFVAYLNDIEVARTPVTLLPLDAKRQE